jgi:hypothetical protein
LLLSVPIIIPLIVEFCQKMCQKTPLKKPTFGFRIVLYLSSFLNLENKFDLSIDQAESEKLNIQKKLKYVLFEDGIQIVFQLYWILYFGAISPGNLISPIVGITNSLLTVSKWHYQNWSDKSCQIRFWRVACILF